MPAERYYLNQILDAPMRCELKGAEFHHLAHVMRTQINDTVELINGKGVLAHAAVETIEKEKAVLRIISTQQEKKRCQLTLAQAIPKPNRLDFIIEKGTELGVDSFFFFPGKLSQKKELFPSQLDRMRYLAISALKQCGRLHLPEIEIKPSLEQWHSLPSGPAFFGDTKAEARLLGDALKSSPPSSLPILFFTGPESGFSCEETRLLKILGAKGVKLHENILRTDTASLAAITLIHHWMIQNQSKTTPL